jgi:hypothetical protein
VEYFGVFLVLVAAALNLLAPYMDKDAQKTRSRPTLLTVPDIPPGAAAVLIAVSGVFIFVVGIYSE